MNQTNTSERVSLDIKTVPIQELLEPFKTSPTVIDGKLKELPLREIGWQDFEKLIARIAHHSLSGTLQSILRYGRQGQKQHGIDIVGFHAVTGKTYVLQCKHVAAVSRGDITKWVNEFLSGEKCKETHKYFLCTSFSIGSDTALVDEWKQAAFSLYEDQIECELWDYDALQQLLRNAGSVVTEFFGEVVAKRFCIQATIPAPTEYPISYRSKFISRYSTTIILENETVRCDLLAPDDRRPTVSALMSFARKDLKGITLGFASDELIPWLQWRAHAGVEDTRPYAISIDSGDRWILNAASARLTLSTEELEHLDWVLKEAWNQLLPIVLAKDAKWQTMRFKSIGHNREDCYAIVSLHRILWRVILDFAREHDCASGNSDWHIFDAAPGVLKVYVHNHRAMLEPGYHLIMYAHNEPGIAGPWDEHVVLGWTPLSDIGGQPMAVGPTKAWDAEYTHNWILKSLVPAVVDWHQKRRITDSKWTLFQIRGTKKGRNSAADLSDWCYSLAQCESRELTRNVEDLIALRAAVSRLQMHFNGGHCDVPIDITLTRSVLKLAGRILPFVASPDEYYIRGKLPLKPELTLAVGLNELAQSDKIIATRNWLESSLRCLSSIIDEAEEIPPSEIGYAINTLIPLWDQFKEDLLFSGLS